VDTNPGAGVTDEATVNIAEFLAGEPAPLSEYARSIEGSTILQIAADIREMLERGERVLNLTVGDFRPDQFPIPARLADFCVEAMREGQTNYPPVPGVMELREAVQELTREELGLNYPIDGILVGGGARPILYASYMALVDPGETVLYPVPSWNNHHYCRLARATGIPLPVTAEKNFHLDRADLEPYLKTARLLAMNSPLNPTGTCISRDALFEICEAIVAENERRRTAGERPLFLIYDQVYNSLTFGDARHWTPMELVPEIAPYTIAMDAVSKRFSGTGIRVGWGIGPPAILKKMSQMAGHYGAWARAAGLPIEHIAPQGAIYLSVRFDLIGKTVADKRLLTNEDIRSLLLSEAGFAVVPFEAFGLEGNSGWMRLSVGAVSVDEVRGGLDRVKALMETRT
jgi:aspartate aminotransferase